MINHLRSISLPADSLEPLEGRAILELEPGTRIGYGFTFTDGEWRWIPGTVERISISDGLVYIRSESRPDEVDSLEPGTDWIALWSINAPAERTYPVVSGDSPFADAFRAYCGGDLDVAELSAESRDEFAQIARSALTIPVIADATGADSALPAFLERFADELERITFEPGKFYVMDTFAHTAQDAYVSGPFGTRAAAEQDRRERNIADDCQVCEAPRKSANVRRPVGDGWDASSISD